MRIFFITVSKTQDYHWKGMIPLPSHEIFSCFSLNSSPGHLTICARRVFSRYSSWRQIRTWANSNTSLISLISGHLRKYFSLFFDDSIRPSIYGESLFKWQRQYKIILILKRYFLYHWYYSTSFVLCLSIMLLIFGIFLTSFYDVKSFLFKTTKEVPILDNQSNFKIFNKYILLWNFEEKKFSRFIEFSARCKKLFRGLGFILWLKNKTNFLIREGFGYFLSQWTKISPRG